VNYRWSKSKDGEICRAVVFLPDVDSGASQQAGGSLVIILAFENRSVDSSAAFLRNTFHATTVIAIAADIVSPAPEQPHLRNTMIRSSQARRRLKKFNIWSSFAPGPENFPLAGKTLAMGVPDDSNISSRKHRCKRSIIRMLRITQILSWRHFRILLLRVELETHNFVRWQCRTRYFRVTSARPDGADKIISGADSFKKEVHESRLHTNDANRAHES
jgi:hypothetical protein